MQVNKKLNKAFLEKFTGEIIHILRKRFLEEEIRKQEEMRRLREIELAKFRKRYEDYLKKEKPAMIPSKKPMEKKKIAPPLPLAPKKEETELKKPLPYKASYLLPNGEIDFSKIKKYIIDQNVTSIECQGPKKPIIIRRGGRAITTKTKLNDNQIDIIIHGFSEKARIPLLEGLLRARVRNMTISAVVSRLVSSRFIITKQPLPAMRPVPAPRRLVAPVAPARMPAPRPALRAPARPPARAPAPRPAPAPKPTPVPATPKPSPKTTAMPSIKRPFVTPTAPTPKPSPAPAPRPAPAPKPTPAPEAAPTPKPMKKTEEKKTKKAIEVGTSKASDNEGYTKSIRPTPAKK